MSKLSRFNFISLFLLSLCMPVCAAQPNVLFIIVDDLTTTLSCMGQTQVNTPHIDALAERGVRFDHAYTQFALCNPSRCSFLTGCYPERTRALDLVTSLRNGLPTESTLPQHFKANGYITGRIGKVFHVPDPKTKLDVELGAPLQRDTALFEEAKATQDPEDKARVTAKGRSYNRSWAASLKTETEFTDYQIASDAIKTLELFKDKPFFLAVGFIRPHTPYVAPKPFFDSIDKAKLIMPPFYREGGEDVSKIPPSALRANNNVFPHADPTRNEAYEATQAYLASTGFVDSQVGRVLAKLKDLSLEENTIVVLTGDHGYQLGEHGLWAKQTLFERGTHVPLIIAAPRVSPGARDGLVEQVDIYPTLCELTGLPQPEHLQGRSLKQMLIDPKAKGKQAAVSTMVSTRTKLTGHSVRTDAFRYIEWDNGRGGEHLYDLRMDPDELYNLASEPTQTERMNRMRLRLASHLKAVTK